MKYLLYIALSFAIFASCEDDSATIFNVDVPKDELTFKSIRGGAVMYYSLPKSKDIYAINIYYTDGQGEKVRISGSYLTDSLVLSGFTTARTGITAQVTLENRDQHESVPVDVTFNTDVSATVEFFDNLKVFSHWNGFRIEYDGLPNTRGIAHVFYKGINPLTNEKDLILLESFPIAEGEQNKYFKLEKGGDFNDVVVSTEDYRGYIAKEETYPNIKSYNQKKVLYGTDFDFLDPFEISYEEEVKLNEVGIKYLFDGNTKGDVESDNDKACYKTFVTMTNSFSTTQTPKFVVVDLLEPKKIGSIRMYAMLEVRHFAPITSSIDDPLGISGAFNNQYPTALPCHVIAYGTNDDGVDMGARKWEKLTEFYQGSNTDIERRWSKNSAEYNGEVEFTFIDNQDVLDAAEEVYLTLEFNVTAPEYRYIRLDVIDTFDYYINTRASYEERNLKQHYSINELEVFLEDKKN